MPRSTDECTIEDQGEEVACGSPVTTAAGGLLDVQADPDFQNGHTPRLSSNTIIRELRRQKEYYTEALTRVDRALALVAENPHAIEIFRTIQVAR